MAERRKIARSYALKHGVETAATCTGLSTGYISQFSHVSEVGVFPIAGNTYKIISALQCRKGATLEAIGLRFKVSRQRIYQILVECRQAKIKGV